MEHHHSLGDLIVIKFRCGACGRKMGVPDGYGGKRVKCTGCGETAKVPEPEAEVEELVELEPVEEERDDSLFDDLMPAKEPASPLLTAVAAPQGAPGASVAAPLRERGSSGAAGERLCPKCGATARGDAAICINCGHSFKLGVNVQTVANAKKAAGLAGRTTFAMIAGGVAALIGGAVWAGIALATDREFGILAWALGGFVGLAVAVVARTQNPMVGFGAAGWTVAGLLLGKLFIFQWVAPAIIAQEFGNDPQVVWSAAAVDLMRAGELTDAQIKEIAAYEASGRAAPLDDEVKQLVDSRVSGMTDAEREAAIHLYVEAVIGEVPLSEQIKSLLSPWDLLWVGLALVTAFKVGSGIVGSE